MATTKRTRARRPRLGAWRMLKTRTARRAGVIGYGERGFVLVHVYVPASELYPDRPDK